MPLGEAEAVGLAEGVGVGELGVDGVGATLGAGVAVGRAMAETVGVTIGVGLGLEPEDIVGDATGVDLNVAFCAILEVAGNNTLTAMVAVRSVSRKVVHSGLYTFKA